MRTHAETLEDFRNILDRAQEYLTTLQNNVKYPLRLGLLTVHGTCGTIGTNVLDRFMVDIRAKDWNGSDSLFSIRISRNDAGEMRGQLWIRAAGERPSSPEMAADDPCWKQTLLTKIPSILEV